MNNRRQSGWGVRIKAALAGLVCLASVTGEALAQRSGNAAADRKLRGRYEEILRRNPFQEQAFDRVFKGYAENEGLAAWEARLRAESGAGKGGAVELILGRLLARQFRIEEAIGALERGVMADGEHAAEARESLGGLYLQTGQDEQAAVNLELAIQGLADVDRRNQACRRLGLIYLRGGEMEKAVSAWEKLVERDPQDLFALQELAAVYEDNQLWNKAISVHEKIVGLAAADPYRRCQSLRRVGMAQVNAGRVSEAVAAFEQAMDLAAPGNWLRRDLERRLVGLYRERGDLAGLLKQVDARLAAAGRQLTWLKLRAEVLEEMGRGGEAEQVYLKLLSRSPRDEQVHQRLLRLCKARGDREGYVRGCERLIELFPDDPERVRQLGEFQFEIGDEEQARATWLRWVAGERGKDAGRLATVASWFEERGMAGEAIEAYQRALALRERREWRLRVALLRFRMGDTDAATIGLLELAAPDSGPDELAEIAAVLEANQRQSEAIGVYRRLLQRSPDRHDLRLRFARTLLSSGRPREASLQFQRVAEFSNAASLRAQGERGWFDALQADGKLAERLAAWEADLAKDPGSVELVSRLVALHERMGDEEEALKWHRRRVELEPRNVAYQAGLAGTHARRGRLLEAIAILKPLTKADSARARDHWRALVGLYDRIDERSLAIEAAESLVGVAPTDPEAHAELAELLQGYGDVERSLDAFRRASQLAPEEPRYIQAEARLLRGVQRSGEASMAYRRLLRMAGTAALRRTALRDLAEIAVAERTFPALVDEFELRVRRAPGRLEAYEELAVIQIAGGREQEGIATLMRARERAADAVGAVRALVKANFEMRRLEDALGWFQTLLELKGNPDDSDYEQLGRIQAQLGKLDEARDTWSRLVERSKEDPRELGRLATLHEQAGILDRAADLRRRAVGLAPGGARLRYAYAKVLELAGRPEESVDQLFALLDLAERQGRTAHPKGRGGIPLGSRNVVSAHLIGRPLSNLLLPDGAPPNRATPTPSPRDKSSKAVWGGDLKARRSLIYDIAGVLRQSGNPEAFRERWRRLMAESPDDRGLRRDWVTVCEASGDPVLAAEAGLDYLEFDAADQEIAIRTAVFLSAAGRMQDAIQLLSKNMGPLSEFGALGAECLVAALLKDGQAARAGRMAMWTLEIWPDSTLVRARTLAGLLFDGEELVGARQMCELLLRGEDPGMRHFGEFHLAEISRLEGKDREAIERFSRIVSGEIRSSSASGKSPAKLYTPTNFSVIPATPDNLGMPQQVTRFADTYRCRALDALDALVPEFFKTRTCLDLENAWVGYRGMNPDERDVAWETVKLAIAYHLREDRNMEALALLGRVMEAGRDDVEVVNLRLFAQQKEFLFDEMRSVLRDYERRHPRAAAAAREALRGVSEIERAPKRISVSVLEGASPRHGLALRLTSNQSRLDAIRRLRETERDHAQALLDRHLESEGRDAAAMQLAAEFARQDGRKVDAIKHIVEAWLRRDKDVVPERIQHTVTSRKTRARVTLPVERLILAMQGIYFDAGRLNELIRLVEGTALTNPSARAWADVVQIHAINGDFDRAAAAFRNLARDYPDAEATRSGLVRLMTVGSRR